MVVMGVWLGTGAPGCASSDQCPQAGTFCMVGAGDRCQYCGGNQPLPDETDPATGGTLNDPLAPDFAGFNLTAVAELCATGRRASGAMGEFNMGDYHTASSITSWCKSGIDALDLSFPELF
jgi:hypothetical protein